MRQGNNNRRQRGRNNRRNNNNQPNRNQVYDSNGPSIRVRGNAQQVMDKYLALARDAQAAGNHVMAEAYFQHGEHYLRIHVANQAAMEEARARKQAQREERQAKVAETEGDQPETLDVDGNDAEDTGAGEAEVIVSAAAIEVVGADGQIDPSQQDQPDVVGVEIVSDEPAAMSLIPDAVDGDEQPEITQL